MIQYNIDNGNGEVEQITCASEKDFRKYLKDQGYVDISISTEKTPIFNAGNLVMYRGIALVRNVLMTEGKKIKFTFYNI